jgi:hypothetical protein
MLIGSGQKPHVFAALTVPPSQHIPGHGGVRVTDVGSVVDVIDRRRDEVGLR